MIQVTFLGVGAAIPAPGATNCCFLLETGDTKILFDCGPTVLQQLASARRSPGDITHLFISHGHGDHALGYPMFLLWWGLAAGRPRAHTPTVIASTATWAHLRALWDHAFKDVPSFAVNPVELPVDQHHQRQLAPTINLQTWPMVHSRISPVLAARFEIGGKVLAFTADSARCDNIVPLARNADLLIHDARYAVTVPPDCSMQGQFHCSARDAGEYAAAAGVRNLALIHIGPEYEGRHAELVGEAKTQFTGHVFAPAPGDVFTLDESS